MCVISWYFTYLGFVVRITTIEGVFIPFVNDFGPSGYCVPVKRSCGFFIYCSLLITFAGGPFQPRQKIYGCRSIEKRYGELSEEYSRNSRIFVKLNIDQWKSSTSCRAPGPISLVLGARGPMCDHPRSGHSPSVRAEPCLELSE